MILGINANPVMSDKKYFLIVDRFRADFNPRFWLITHDFGSIVDQILKNFQKTGAISILWAYSLFHY